MQVTGTHINYYFVCKRKLWLFGNGMNMEHTSEAVYEGKLIHKKSYPQRSERYEELEIEGCKIDFYDAHNKIVHEIKKSDKIELAHEWQVKYYIFVLERHGVEGVTGILEYPMLRQTNRVDLTVDSRQQIIDMEIEIQQLIESDSCPPVINSQICKKCSYYEFCYVDEA